MSQLTLALAGGPGAAQRLQVAASASLAGALASTIQAAGRSIAESSGLSASLSSPPRPAVHAGYLRGSVAPSYCLAGGKTRRRKRRRPDGEPSGGGGDGGDDGFGGGSGWFGPWDEEPEGDEPGSGEALEDSAWVMRFCLLLTVLQTLHYMMLASGRVQRQPAACASLSQAFFSPRGGLRPLPALPLAA